MGRPIYRPQNIDDVLTIVFTTEDGRPDHSQRLHIAAISQLMAQRRGWLVRRTYRVVNTMLLHTYLTETDPPDGITPHGHRYVRLAPLGAQRVRQLVAMRAVTEGTGIAGDATDAADSRHKGV